jgi:hypothetical protein
MSAIQVLRTVVAALDQAGIAYMLSGSLASAYYGALRSTQDIDVIIEATPEQLRALVNSLPRDSYYADLDAALEAQRRQSLFNIIDMATGWKVDMIIRKQRTFSQEEFSRRRRVKLDDLSVFVATAEDLIIAKLEWSKQAQSARQLDDVATMLRIRLESLDRSYLEKWIRELGVEEQWEAARTAASL